MKGFQPVREQRDSDHAPEIKLWFCQSRGISFPLLRNKHTSITETRRRGAPAQTKKIEVREKNKKHEKSKACGKSYNETQTWGIRCGTDLQDKMWRIHAEHDATRGCVRTDKTRRDLRAERFGLKMG